MKHVVLERSDGKDIRLSLPETPDEVTAKQYVNFNVNYNNLMANISRAAKEGLILDKNLGYVINMMELLKAVFPEIEDDLLAIDVSAEVNKELILNADELQKFTEEGVEIDLESAVSSFEKIIGHMYQVIHSWKPKLPEGEFKFSRDGRVFTIPEVRKDMIWKSYKFGKVTLGKLIETQKVHKLISDKAEANKAKYKNNEEINDKADPDGSLAFTKLINTLAMLVDEEGKKTPNDPKQFDRVVEQRIELFQDIPMTIARNATFFLLSSSGH